MHLNPDAFRPATEAEKEYISQMRPSSTFFKDGCKRLMKNKVATASLIIIIVVTLSSILLPLLWPYSYDAMLGVRPGKPADSSFNNLQPFTYGKTELKRIAAAPTPTAAITSSAWSTARASRWLSASSPASSC